MPNSLYLILTQISDGDGLSGRGRVYLYHQLLANIVGEPAPTGITVYA